MHGIKKIKRLEVDKCYVVATDNWRLSKSGDILHIDEIVMSSKITGSGKQLDNFLGVENSFVGSANEMKSSGG
ncbi:MAG: hypothetical protein GX640_17870 [Fibrobacter sp.]|nr:hypothetical protein [Fibrobacter sp.]